MYDRIKRFKRISAFLVIMSSLLFACSQKEPLSLNSPNFPFQGELPTCFVNIENLHPKAAYEIKKFPDILDGVSSNEIKGIDKIIRVIEANPQEFDSTFNEMYSIGKSEHRKYCAPLQALFWISQNFSEEEVFHHVRNFDLNNLLNVAWGNPKHFDKVLFTKKEFEEIINNMNHAQFQKMWKSAVKNNHDLI